MVVCYHGQIFMDGSSMGERLWINVSRAGWCGVDLFFVLSGFLITTILIETRQDAHYFRNFFMRRVLRIFPLYYVSLIVLFSWITGLKDGESLWHYLFAQNWRGLFGQQQSPGPLLHFWSLAVEEQFYLVWPVVIWWIRPKNLPAFCLATIIISFVARCIAKWNNVPEGILHGLTPFRIDSLAMGALVASCRAGQHKERLAQCAPFVFVATLISVLVITILEEGSPYGVAGQTIGYTLFAGLCAALIAMIVDRHPFAKIPCRFFESGLLRYLGNRSYAIYIVHAPVLLLAVAVSRQRPGGDATGIRDVIYFVVAVGITILIAELSWHLLEKPFLRLKRWFPKSEKTPSRRIEDESQTQTVV